MCTFEGWGGEGGTQADTSRFKIFHRSTHMRSPAHARTDATARAHIRTHTHTHTHTHAYVHTHASTHTHTRAHTHTHTHNCQLIELSEEASVDQDHRRSVVSFTEHNPEIK